MTEIQGLTGAVSGAAARAASTASAGSLTLPAAPLIATYPITGTTTITSITAGSPGQIALLEFASAGCRVVMGSNLVLNGDYLSTASGFLTLVANGSNWEEVARTSTVPQAPQNALVNGNFSVWQRGTSFPGLGSGLFFADRWQWSYTGAANITMAQDTSVPTVGTNAVNTPYSAKLTVPTTPDTSIAAGDLYVISQNIEGYDYRALTNGMALSFWVKAHRTGIYCVSLRNSGNDRSYVAEYTINAADTWEYKTVVVPAPPTAGTWNYTNGVGLGLGFSIAMGSTYQSTAGSWQTGNFMSTANQVNGVGATSDTLSLALVNLVPGAIAYPLNPYPYEQEFARCQRYYEVHGSAQNWPWIRGYGAAGSQCGQSMGFAVPKGGTPTMTKSGTWTVNNCGQPAVAGVNSAGYVMYAAVTATGDYSFYTDSSDDTFTAEWNPT